MTTDNPPIYKRRWFIVAAIAAAVPVLALAWWLGSPLFIDRTVIEDFPRAAAAEIPADMTAEQVETEMLEAESVTVTADDDMPAAAEPDALVSGEITGADDFHRGSGTATIYQLEDGSRILRLENLDVTNGPDLHVLLSPVADPQNRDEVTATGYIDLGSLKGNQGDQNYEIPVAFEIGAELSVVIYCVPFHVIFSTASLS